MAVGDVVAARRRAQPDPRLTPRPPATPLRVGIRPRSIHPRTKATTMKRIGILTAGGDTPGPQRHDRGGRPPGQPVPRRGDRDHQGVQRPAQPRRSRTSTSTRSSTTIPELDATRGGTILGASRDYVDGDDTETIARVADRLQRLQIDGLICVGGDGTLNGMQPLSDHLPVVLAPKTIDNDLGLNYPDEPNEWIREPDDGPRGYVYKKRPGRDFGLDEMVNYVTPGLRHGGLRLVAERPADPDHGREPPPDRHHRGHGPRLRDDRAGDRLRPARHHPRARVARRPRPAGRAGARRSSTSRSTP